MRANGWIGLGCAAVMACAFGEAPGNIDEAGSAAALPPPAATPPADHRFASTPQQQRASAVLRDRTGREVATAELVQDANGVRVAVTATGLPPGRLAVHIHENGACEPPDFASAGSHFAPGGRQHGIENPAGPHAGDLPNIHVAPDGSGRVAALDPWVSLRDGDAGYLLGNGGTSIVVHEGADDYFTDPSGDSGDRIACGVITP